MEGKTDKEIFGDDSDLRKQNGGTQGGRPSINRDLARRLFQGGFSTRQVASKLKCHIESARKIRRELEDSGDLESKSRKSAMTIVQADFDAECEMARGISFSGWLETQTPSAHRRIFLFCQRTWENPNIWDRPSLVLVRDRDNNLGDQLCLKFLQVFDDKNRSRDRLKQIRYIFRFLGRKDLCDQFLTMTDSRNPRAVKRVPQIPMQTFPAKATTFFETVNCVNEEIGIASEFKLVTQMRTGKKKDGRGLMGLRVGSSSEEHGNHKSYIVMEGPDDFAIHVLEKKGEEWDIGWLPRRVKDRLWELYQQRKAGDFLFSFSVTKLRKQIGDTAEETLGFRAVPHDLRKISITWLYVMGVPLELAVEMNVGWKDLNTAKKNYLHMRNLLKKSDRLAYRDNIPEWYKDGLQEYTEEK